MAESRRVQLTTLHRVDAPSPAARARPPCRPQEGDGGPDGAGGAAATVRLYVTLFEPDDRSFPEFSYGQLVDSQTNHTKEELPLSRFEEDKRANDEVAAMTRKLEEKYGGKPKKKKKKKKDRIQDLIDIGFGYDDEDSFIDNSEAYDEFVPASISTKFGGFYVNSGVLQFRQTSETEDLATEEETPEPSKKRKVSGGRDKPKKKRCSEGGERMSDVNPKSSTLPELGHKEEMPKRRKKKKAVGTLSVTSMLKKFQREKEKERQKMEKANRTSAAVAVTTPLCPADAGGGGGSGLTDPLLCLIGSTNDHALIQAANAVDFDIDLDSLLDVTEETSSPKVAPQPQPGGTKTGDLTRSDPAPQVHPPNPAETPLSEQIQLPPQTSSVPLPEGLPSRLEDSIRKLMAVAKTLGAESKLKFFTPEINSILLDIELQCREQGAQSRSRVYTHLSAFLPCSRDTLLKRVKKLLLAHADGPPDVDEAMQKLQEAISRAMPEQLACFYETCQLYEQVKTSKAAEEEKDGPEDNVEEKGGRKGGGPRKLFKWNEEIRESLRQVLSVKMERYQKEGNGSQEMEQHLKTLLDTEVQPLWPKGWMQSRVLRRESRKTLSLFTPSLVQRVRPEKKQPTSGASPAASDSSGVLRGLPLVADDVVIVSSHTSSSTPVGGDKREAAAHQKAEGKPGDVAVDDKDKPRVNATSTPTHSLLNLLADQALAKEQPLPVSLLAAAVAKYRCSAQRWSFGEDGKSPLLPPPPPQSSPVGFPLHGGVHVVLPRLLQVGDLARHMDPDHVQVISDDEDIAIQ